MTNKSRQRHGMRGNAKFRLNRTTRAIRNAIAFGLAVAMSGPVLAGTCDVSDPSNATCDGVFAGVGISYSIDDLTLVVGGALDTSIDPGDGVIGIDLYSATGSISLSSAADIASNYADGIEASTYSGAISVTNTGSIDTWAGTGIDAGSFSGEIDVYNAAGAEVHASNAYGSATGIMARNYYADVSVTNYGVVDASVVGYGNATGINASSFTGEVSVLVGYGGEVSASTDDIYGGTAIGVRAGSVLGASGVANYGDISAEASGEYGNVTAYGVRNSGGYYGITSVANAGTISASASTGDGVGWAWGVRVRGSNAQMDNDGTISADAYAGNGYASASASYVRGNYASTTNEGDISAHAAVGDTGQALSYGAMTWGYVSSYLENTGSIAAYASTGAGTAVAMGTSAHYDHASTVINSGSILSDGYSGLGFVESVGVYNYALDTASVENVDTGGILALAEVGNGYAFAYGAWLDSGYDSTLLNDGSIDAQATVVYGGAFQDYGGMARSIGASVKARYGEASIYNAEGAVISAYSGVHGEYGRAYSFGAVAQGEDMAYLSNAGSIQAEAYSVAGVAVALGDLAYGSFAVNINSGALGAAATVDGAGYAQAIGQYSFGEVSTVINEGVVSASAAVGDGQANATGGLLYGAYVAAYNYNEIGAVAHADTGEANAYGVAAYGFLGAKVYNGGDGSIDAQASAGVGDATAQGVNNFAYVYGAYVTNAGTISASANTGYGSAVAVGVVNTAYLYGQSVVVNDGDILASASSGDYGSAEAVGVYAYGLIYGPTVSNNGNISASASSQGYATATAVAGVFYTGYSLLENHGELGADAVSLGGMYGTAEAVGVDVETLFGKYNLPEVVLVNDGAIVATAVREGDYGYASATGVSIDAMYVTQLNYGEISASASADGAYAGAGAIGSMLLGKYAVVAVNEAGINAQASANHGGDASATGLLGSSYYGGAALANHADVGAIAVAAFDGYVAGSAYAGGVSLHGNYLVELYNTGSITALASAEHGDASALGFSGSSKYDIATMHNAGDIIARAYGGSAEALGSEVSSKYGASTFNDADIAAYAYADYYAHAVGSVSFGPGAHGYFEGAIGALLYNYANISATAVVDSGEAVAIGARAEASQDAGAYLYNAGLISAHASAGEGSAFATGTTTWSYYGAVELFNLGDIEAVALAGDYGQAVAIGSVVRAEGFGPPGYAAGSASLYNDGDISAVASTSYAGGSWANGVVVIGEQGASIESHGDISARASADAGAAYATAVIASSLYGDALLTNYGNITAIAEAGTGGLAIAVYLDSASGNVLRNYGDIVATGAGSAHVAVQSSIAAQADIGNHGVRGSILTGDLDDSLHNYAGASIVLRNDLIDLGAWSAYGNSFSNEGLVVVRGGDNLVDMGSATTLLADFNPLAFVNDGSIDFHDGAADDALTVAGDLSGHGELNVDINGALGASDELHVAGSVVDGGVQTINIWFTGLPTSAASSIDIVTVSGDAAAGDFVLGDFHNGLDAGFLALEFGLHADIDASNARDDAFALTVDVSGLSDAGVLASSIAAGAQSLLDSQVGTWRERMGLNPRADKGGLSLWARLFQAKGEVAPEHRAADFGQGGHFDFEQKNSGMEAGLEFALTDEFSIGALLAKSEGRQHLRSPGAGGSRIEADTWGLYATWVSPNGFYLDGSWRQSDFTASIGALEADGEVETFNLEAGYAWTLSNGAQLEPQFQYRRSRVDGIDAISLGATQLRPEGGDSSAARLGLMLSKSMAASGGSWTWTPHAVLSAVREFDGEYAFTINDDFHGSTSTGGTSALVQVGVTARSGGFALSGGLNWQDGGALDSFFGGQLNLRYSW